MVVETQLAAGQGVLEVIGRIDRQLKVSRHVARRRPGTAEKLLYMQ